MSAPVTSRPLATLIQRLTIRTSETGNLSLELARDAIGTLLLRAASGVLALAGALLLARMLGASRYGAYAWAVAWVTVLSIPGKLGMDRLLVRDVAGYATTEDWPALRGLVRRSTQWVVGTSVAIAVATALIASTVGIRQATLRNALVAGLAMLPFVSLVGLYQGGLQGFRRVVIALVPDQIARPLLFIVLILASRVVGARLDAVPALLLQLGATVCGFALTWRLFSKTLPHAARHARPIYSSRAWSTSALSMLVISAVVLIYARLDVIMLGAMRGAKAAGVYSSAVSAASMILLPLGAANMALAPMVPRLYAAGQTGALQRNVTLINRVVFVVTLVAAVGMSAMAGVLLGFFGTQFTTGAAALQILLAAQVVTAVASTSVMLLTMTHQEHAAAAWITAAAGLNVGLDVALIPPFGLVGSSIATLLASTLQTLALTVLVRRRLRIDSTILGSPPSGGAALHRTAR
jgi:O-antigen/teichoic acid export membrane protein